MKENPAAIYRQQLCQLLRAESHLTAAFPNLALDAHDLEVRRELHARGALARKQRTRLLDLLAVHGWMPAEDACEETCTMVRELKAEISGIRDKALHDLRPIEGVRRISEHEAAGYAHAIELTLEPEFTSDSNLLRRSLDEEAQAVQAWCVLIQHRDPHAVATV